METAVIGINAGSGQRPFTSLPDEGVRWINLDINPKWTPDIVGDWNDLSMFEDNSIDYVVSCHSIEHCNLGTCDGFIRESHRVLRDSGQLLILVPDPKALCRAYLDGKIDDYIFNVNTYGAWMGDVADLHKWSYSRQAMVDLLRRLAKWEDVHAWDGRNLPGADLPGLDWWYYGMVAVK